MSDMCLVKVYATVRAIEPVTSNVVVMRGDDDDVRDGERKSRSEAEEQIIH
jgi:hypothetical protein